MIGRGRGKAGANQVLLESHDSATAVRAAIVRANRFVGLDIAYSSMGPFSGSDHHHFRTRGVPVGLLHTGLHPDYHKTTDRADRIEYAKMVRILRLAFAAAWDLADRSGRFGPTRRM
jgi:hypothetical protein